MGARKTVQQHPQGADPLERRLAAAEETARELREAVREGHELLAALREERRAVEAVRADITPGALAGLADELMTAAAAAAVDRYEASVREAIASGLQRAFERFDQLMADLMGDEGGDTLEESLRRFLDRQRKLAQAAPQ
jgi:hypothetical protein